MLTISFFKSTHDNLVNKTPNGKPLKKLGSIATNLVFLNNSPLVKDANALIFYFCRGKIDQGLLGLYFALLLCL